MAISGWAVTENSGVGQSNIYVSVSRVQTAPAVSITPKMSKGGLAFLTRTRPVNATTTPNLMYTVAQIMGVRLCIAATM